MTSFYEVYEAGPDPQPARTDDTEALRITDPRKWVATALAAECEAVTEAHEGTRNARLNEAAFKVGTWRAGGLPVPDDATDRLADAASHAGLGGDEVRKTMRSGLRGGERAPLVWAKVDAVVSTEAAPFGVVEGAAPAADWAPPVLSRDEQVERLAHHMRLQHEARVIVEAERQAAQFKVPPSHSATAFLTMPDEANEWLVDEVLPFASNTSITAGFKTGKTTLTANLVRSLVDGEPFLGAYTVIGGNHVGRVAVWDYEMSARQLRVWLRDVDIKHTDAIEVMPLRGMGVPLGTPYVAEWAVDWLRANRIGVWLVDPFARAYLGDENDNAAVTAWTDLVDRIKHAADVHTFLMSVHTGRSLDSAERARGATRLDDWPDVRWLLTQDEGRRFFRATGRDVDLAETGLDYDKVRRTYTAGGGDRGHVRKRTAEARILAVIVERPGINTTELWDAVGRSDANTKALDGLVSAHLVRREKAARNSFKHYANRDTVTVDPFAGVAA